MEKIPVTNYPMPEYLMLYELDGLESELSASSAMERLVNEFESHEEKERELVHRYKEMVQESRKPFVEFLVRLIIADEEKHHQVTHAMLSTLKGDLLWTRPKDAIQGLTALGDGHGELLKLTEDFIELEKSGIQSYKKLVKESKGFYHGLFAMLFETMIRDSEKHVEMLEFLRDRLREV
jgi:bacterioferritin (cytochrome b1)